MSPAAIYSKFMFHFPHYTLSNPKFKVCDKNSICIQQTDGKEFIFTYFNDNDWSFRTNTNYMRGMKK